LLFIKLRAADLKTGGPRYHFVTHFCALRFALCLLTCLSLMESPTVRTALTVATNSRFERYCPLPSAATPSVPPRPMVSTTDEGTMTIEPRSLMAS
jgi:hypothetical protein